MNIVKRFQKHKEDFACQMCGAEMVGDGYTNHCNQCLTSKHVDIFPGDRLEDCGGMMPVVEVQRKGDGYILTHRCLKCQSESKDSFREGDNIDALIAVSKKS